MSQDEATAPKIPAPPEPDATRASADPPKIEIGEPHLAVLLATNKNFQSAAIMGIMAIAFDCCMNAAVLPSHAVEITPGARIKEFSLDEGFGLKGQSAANRIATARRLSGNIERTGAFVDIGNPNLAAQFDGAGIIVVFDDGATKGAESINPIATVLAGVEITGPALVLAKEFGPAEAWSAARRGK